MKKKQNRRDFLKSGAMAGTMLFVPKGLASLSGPPPDKGRQQSAEDLLMSMGLLDVTKDPYLADPTGKKDSTTGLQWAVNDARDKAMVSFFPSGTYLISDTISCEQRVQKLDKPRYTDNMRQSWWDIGTDRFYLLGSTKEPRPVLKLSHDAKGFDNPDKPKIALKIWAQTRNDLPGTHDPEWGLEQPGISFSHIFRGIDFDISGHPGAIGFRHAGSQGSALMDCTVHAAGAFAGFHDCPGQGGGTYNISTIGGRYGLIVDSNYRFPMLASCSFTGQTIAPVLYVEASLPLMLVGCYLESNGPSVIDLTKMTDFPGITMVDCVIKMNSPGLVIGEKQNHNVFMENVFIKGARHLQKDGKKIPDPDKWTEVTRYSNCAGNSENLINGVISQNTFLEWKTSDKEPSAQALHDKHWRKLPSFEDADALNVKSLGAVGDGSANDTEAVRKALKSSKKVFFPKGNYKLTEDLILDPGMQIFGIKGSNISVPSVKTCDNTEDDTFLSHISVNGILEWGSGKGIMAFANGRLKFLPNGGGRFYALRGIGGRGGEDAGKLFEGTRQPISLYTLNIERRTTNPQSFVRDVKNFSIFYLKCEASPVGYTVEKGDDSGNTPLAIFNSEDVKIYCACGNVLTSLKRPFIDIVNSHNVVVTHVKSFKTADFPQIRETYDGRIMEIPSDRVAALFIRD
jgi:hypothetical protein